jgi:hypothetical protein
MEKTSWSYFIGAFFISVAIAFFSERVRRKEEKQDNAFAHEAEPHKLYWRVAHMRDDAAAIVGLLCFTNGLLAAILGVLLK